METEERAKLMGWVPIEDFKGDPDKHVSAEDYVDRADNIMPIMKSQMGKYEETIKSQKGEIASTKEELASLRKTMEKVVSIHKDVSKREYDRAKETIRKEQQAAIDDNDGEKWARLEADKDRLEEPEVVEIKTPEPDPDKHPDFLAWKEKNPWFDEDPVLKRFADDVAEPMSEHGKLTGTALFEAVEKRVKETFPDKFKNPNRDKASDVSSGTNQGGAKSKANKGYNDLPAEAKEACDRFVAEGLYENKAEYSKVYWEAD